jgi:hypothetical protein
MTAHAFTSAAVAIALCATSVVAQPPCEDPQWLPGVGAPGTDGTVEAAAAWDPDGPGPKQAVLVIGGNFSIAGDAEASNLAVFDPVGAVWSSLGGGLDGRVRAIAALPDGGLVVGGDFTRAGGLTAPYIALWNGQAWKSLVSGMDQPVFAVAVMPDGDIVAGGQFATAGGLPARRIARWNGQSWSALGSGVSATVQSLAVLPEGTLVAGAHLHGRATTAMLSTSPCGTASPGRLWALG